MSVFLLRVLSVCFLLLAVSAESGEQACEGKRLSKAACEAVGCCSWNIEIEDGEQCASDVDANECVRPVSPDSIVLPTYGTGAWKPVWKDVTGGKFKSCGKVARVFGVVVCVTPAAWAASPAKCSHIAGVLAQLLDNDADGKADDPPLVRYMAANHMSMWVPATESDASGSPIGQMTGIWETVPNSCDTPTNRGASGTDRSTWAAAVDATPGATGCDPARDATTEEVFHLITEGAAKLWPAIWGASKASKAGAATFPLNGNCGWGYAGTYKNPSLRTTYTPGTRWGCVGTYAYNDKTCDERCVVVEGVYWATVTNMGGLYTTARASSVKQEWLLTVPDKGMAALPRGVANAATFEEGAPALHALVTDTESDGHKWLPSIMPDGKYVVADAKAVSSPGRGIPTLSGASRCAAAPLAGTLAAAVVVALVAAL